MLLKLCIVILAGVKAYLGYLFLVEKLDFILFQFIFSPVISVLLYLLFGKYIRNKSWLFTILVLDFFLPLYGIMSVFLTFLLGVLFRYSSSSPDDNESFYLKDFEKNILTKQNNIEYVENTKNKEAEQNLLQPYLDIFMGKNNELKIDACIKLSNFSDTSSVKLLQVALQDEQYDVRYMANNALGKIEKKFMLKLEQLTKLIKKFPDYSDNYMARAETYTFLYSTGILDETISKYFLNKALADLKFVLNNQPHNFFVHIKLAYVYTQLGNFQEVLNVIEPAFGLEISENEKNKLLFFAAEAHFALRDFSTLNSVIEEIKLESVKYDKILNSTLYWRGIIEPV